MTPSLTPVPQSQKLLSSKTDSIAIVGAGIFGLSTAIYLAERGYTDITIFDKQPYHDTLYSFDKGCDGASSDRNKIIRCAYGDETLYQNMTLRALPIWEAWNQQVSSASPDSPSSLPPGFTPSTKIYINNGLLHIPDSSEEGLELSQFELDSIAGITAEGFGHTQYVLSKPEERTRAERDGFGFAVDPFSTSRRSRGKQLRGLLDTAGGTVYADRACRYALWRAEKLGVKTIFGSEKGAFESFLENQDGDKRVTGIHTKDGKSHQASLVIVATGGWTPTLLPELDGLAETTCGTVVFLRIPRTSPLWHKYAPENFPVWTFQARTGDNGGAYGFPRDEEGIMKVAYRGTKYTNPVRQPDGTVRSEPVTKWSGPKDPSRAKGKSRIDNEVPVLGLNVLKDFLNEFMPDLAKEGIHIEGTRLCWYTDTFDNHYLIDAVPGRPGVMTATGGSGHAFKMLPVIGSEVVDRIEGKETSSLKTWAWRTLGKEQKADNVLMEGEEGRRNLWNVELSRETDLRLGTRVAKL